LNPPVNFSHENKQYSGVGDTRIVDLRFERIGGDQTALSGATFGTGQCHRNFRRQACLGASGRPRLKMTGVISDQMITLMAAIEQAGIPALRVAFTVGVIIFLFAGVFIWRRRHQFFDRDPNVENDVPVVRHNREEVIAFVWGGLTLVLLFILYQVWSA
jgi:hypothetical protein